MENNVVWLSTNDAAPGSGYWDQTLLSDMFSSKRQFFNHSHIPDSIKEAVVVVPGAYQDVDKVNTELAKLKKCTVIVTSDEENNFDLEKLNHNNMKLFATYAYDTKAKVTWLPIGYTPHSKTTGWLKKDIDILFAGQVNHESREEMVKQVSKNENFELDASSGFSQGLEKDDYITKTRRAKVIPSPRGNISPDSFRMYEALEHGALPVCENRQFFEKIFKNPPFSIIEDVDQWSGYTQDGVDSFPLLQNRASSWWQRYKCELYSKFNKQDDITIVIPISPIKSHPSTKILDETIKSIRCHLDCQIILTFDGVRQEQEDRRGDYELFINNVLSSGHDRIYPIIFQEHTHQSGMMREALNFIKTPLVLYIEQDTPLVTDELIEWDKIKNFIKSGDSNLVRFHFEGRIPTPHKHMMHGIEGGFMKTSQWSQRPHLASTAFYRRVMSEYFTEKSKSFIEDNMHGVLHNSYTQDGLMGWNQFRVHIYHPEDNIKRSLHTDGRESASKYDDTQVF